MVKCKITRSFGCYVNYKVGEVRLLTEEDAKRYAVMVEPINSTERQPDKSYKEGKNKRGKTK